MRRTLAGALGLAVVCAASSSRADETTTFRVEYAASSASSVELCPDRDAFVREIFARTQRPRLVTTEEPKAIVLHVVLEAKDATNASGRLDVKDADGATETRAVTSRTCTEVAKALALVAALVLDPDARTEPEVAPSPPPSLPPPPPPPPPPSLPPPPPPPPPPSPRAVWIPSVGVELGALSSIGPALGPMAGAFFDLEHRTARGYALSARLSLDVARTESDLARGGTQTYEWLGGLVRACPIYVALPVRWRAAPCAGMQIGMHRGTTQQVPNPTSSTEAWLAPAGIASLEWAVTREIVLELSGGALFPLRRTRYFLAPDTTIFEVPAVGGMASFALRVRIF